MRPSTRWPFAVAALSVSTVALACGGRPPAQARTWLPQPSESTAHSRSTIAAIVAAPPPPAPTPAKQASAVTAAPPKAKRNGRPSVRLFTSDGADCPTEALGVVNERAYGDEDEALDRLKEKARAMGADAVVGYRTTSGSIGTDLAGVAVRCRTLAASRPYDTIGELEVPAEPGLEDAAFDELLAKADDMHANLVIGVHVVPGKGSDPSKVVGAAIRYR